MTIMHLCHLSKAGDGGVVQGAVTQLVSLERKDGFSTKYGDIWNNNKFTFKIEKMCKLATLLVY